MVFLMNYEVEKKAKLYFKSIVETANFKKNQDKLIFDIKQVQKLLILSSDDEQEDLLELKNKFHNLSKIQQLEIIKTSISASNLHQYTKKFLNLILETESLDVFIYFIKYFFALKSEYEAIQQVIVYSVVCLNPTQKKKIEKIIKNKITIPLYFDYKIDNTLLAGLKIKIASKVYDSTLINKINRLEISLKGKYNV